MRAAVKQIKGTYALVVISAAEPTRIVCTRESQPMVLGYSEGQNFVASDVAALLEHTRDVVFMEDGDVAVVMKAGIELTDRTGAVIKRKVTRASTGRRAWPRRTATSTSCTRRSASSRARWPTPCAGRMLRSEGDVHFDGWPFSEAQIKAMDRVWILACGTSWHSGLAGKWMIESLARIPVEVELASEFRYRDPIVSKSQLAVAISQSGETLDTLAAMREAKTRGATTMTLCNVVGSAMTREADFTVLTNAGPEIGVASTKAFTTQLVGLYLLAIKLGRLRGTLSKEQAQEHLTLLSEVPKVIEAVLQDRGPREGDRAQVHARAGLPLPRARSDAPGGAGGRAQAQGDLLRPRRGLRRRRDEARPHRAHRREAAGGGGRSARAAMHYEKIIGNIEEVRARGGQVIAVVEEGDEHAKSLGTDFIEIPKTSALIAPLIATIPLQLLAYHVADLRGTDVDQPRNLAKSVTVE